MSKEVGPTPLRQPDRKHLCPALKPGAVGLHLRMSHIANHGARSQAQRKDRKIGLAQLSHPRGFIEGWGCCSKASGVHPSALHPCGAEEGIDLIKVGPLTEGRGSQLYGVTAGARQRHQKAVEELKAALVEVSWELDKDILNAFSQRRHML